MARVLFVGGTGNISGAVTRVALSAGFEVFHLNRGNRPALPGVTTIQADIHDSESVKVSLGKVVGKGKFDSVVNWVAFDRADVQRDFESFRDLTDQYVFISSASAYQKPPRTPWVTESTPLDNPHWEYSRNKIAAEEECLRLYREERFPVTIVRPSLTYDTVFPVALGGWNCFTVIDRLRKGKPLVIHGDGTSLWTITHAEDFGRGFIGLLGNPYTLGEAFHITSDEVLTWNQIYGHVAAAAGVEGNFIHIPTDFIARFDPNGAGGLVGDKAHSAIFDNAKIKKFVPGFRAEIPFHEGIRRTVAWFESDPRRQIINDENNDYLDRLIAAYGHD